MNKKEESCLKEDSVYYQIAPKKQTDPVQPFPQRNALALPLSKTDIASNPGLIKQDILHPKDHNRENKKPEDTKQEVTRQEAARPEITKPETTKQEENRQLNLFDEKILTQKHRDKFKILAQVFNTYWLINYEEKLLFVDQHSAHEKVKFEALMQQYKEGSVASQLLTPPLILHLTQKETAVLSEYKSYFETLGFRWEDFGPGAIAVREMPLDLYGKSEKYFFHEILDEIMENGCKGTPEIIQEKIISMACKAAVKGNQSLSKESMEALLEQLFTLENPYHCPHGRPTIISMTKTELEKKFKRIL